MKTGHRPSGWPGPVVGPGSVVGLGWLAWVRGWPGLVVGAGVGGPVGWSTFAGKSADVAGPAARLSQPPCSRLTRRSCRSDHYLTARPPGTASAPAPRLRAGDQCGFGAVRSDPDQLSSGGRRAAGSGRRPVGGGGRRPVGGGGRRPVGGGGRPRVVRAEPELKLKLSHKVPPTGPGPVSGPITNFYRLGPAAAPGGPAGRRRNAVILGCGAGRSLAA